MKKILFSLFLLIFLSATAVVYARIGVGVGTGKIVVNEELKPGLIYNLPPLTVVNTGDEASNYQVTISYHEKQPELRPEEAWFRFSPKEFQLKPGEVKVVNITLDLPVNAAPGKYFGYLEAHPLEKVQQGKTRVGVAAAAKLYFTVVPANMLQGLYYKIVSFWNVYAPWPQYSTIFLGVLVAIALIKKNLHIEVGLKGKKHKPEKETHDE